MLILLLTSVSLEAGWFDNKDEKLLAEAKEQLERERHKVETWQFRAGALAIGCISLLIVGTMLGSHTRRADIHSTKPSAPDE